MAATATRLATTLAGLAAPAGLHRLQRARPAASEPADAAIALGKDEIARVEHPLGVTISCRSGRVWLTNDRDRKDVVLDAGESHVCDRDSRLTMQALRACLVLVTPAPG
jgi:hypothetical protein